MSILAERKKAWRDANPERSREINRAWMKASPLNYMLGVAKRRAREKGLEFAITKADFPAELPTHCPVLGIELHYGGGNGKRLPSSASIDRRDSSLGYVSGNVQIISWRANDLKGDATLEELEAVVAHMRSF